jgi:heme A synthase
MNNKQLLVGLLVVVMIGGGIIKLMPTLQIFASSAFSLIGIVVVVGLLGYGAYRILRD